MFSLNKTNNFAHDVLQHYEDDADGLCTKLIKPLQKEGSYVFAVDRNAFAEQGWVIKLKDLKLGAKIGKGDFGGITLAFQLALWFYFD